MLIMGGLCVLIIIFNVIWKSIVRFWWTLVEMPTILTKMYSLTCWAVWSMDAGKSLKNLLKTFWLALFLPWKSWSYFGLNLIQNAVDGSNLLQQFFKGTWVYRRQYQYLQMFSFAKEGTTYNYQRHIPLSGKGIFLWWRYFGPDSKISSIILFKLSYWQWWRWPWLRWPSWRWWGGWRH